MSINDMHHDDRQMTGPAGMKRPPALVQSQVIYFALLFGVVIFAIIATVVGPTTAMGTSADMLLMLRLVFVPLCLMGFAMAWFVPRIMAKQAGDRPSDQMFLTQTIIRGVMLETPALFACILLLLSGELADLILVAIPVFAMLTVFPTDDRWRRFTGSTSA